MYRFAPSQLNLIHECPRCFWRAYVAKKPRPRGIFPGLLGAIDRLVQKETAKFAGNGKPRWLLPEMKEGIIREGTKRFATQGNNWTLNGVVDDLIVGNNGIITIIDYKTARAAHSLENSIKYYGLQMDCYALLCEANHLRIANKAYLVYTTPDYLEKFVYLDSFGMNFKITHVPISVSAQRAREAIEQALQICMEKEAPPAPDGCEYCRYHNQS